jgi:hypothetical protein
MVSKLTRAAGKTEWMAAAPTLKTSAKAVARFWLIETGTSLPMFQ